MHHQTLMHMYKPALMRLWFPQSWKEMIGYSCFQQDPPPRPSSNPGAWTSMESTGDANEHHTVSICPLMQSLSTPHKTTSTPCTDIGCQPVRSGREVCGATSTRAMHRAGRHAYTPAPKNTWGITKVILALVTTFS